MPLDVPAAVDQKSNPAYNPGVYNGGDSRRGAWPGGLKDVSPSGFRGRAPVGVLDEVPQKLKQNVKLLYNF